MLYFTVVPEQSEARYRAREQLAGRSIFSDAVGVTKTITGTIVLTAEGQVVREQSKISVDLRTLTSDESRRDNFIKNNTLETSRFPMAEFVPTEIKGLPFPLPTSGQAAFQIVGDMTVHGVTKSITWDVTAEFTPEQVKGLAKTAVTFADFGMTKPRVAVVLSIEDNLRLEIEFTARRTA